MLYHVAASIELLLHRTTGETALKARPLLVRAVPLADILFCWIFCWPNVFILFQGVARVH
jgi:hypothetical protein